MDLRNTRLETAGGIAVVTVARPEKLNALNAETLDELDRIVSALAEDDAVRGVVVTGAGDKAFVAGADIRELAGLGAADAHQAARRGQAIFRRLETLPKPVVAAVSGFALGGGLELALACHLRIASENAKLGLPEVSLGVIPGYGGTQRLARLVGRGRALELILTGAPVDAAEAHRIGLVNRVVSRDVLMDEARDLLGRICRNGPLAIGHALAAVDRGLGMELEQGAELEATLFGLLFDTADAKEGMSAFLEKRPAAFEGK